MNEIPIVRFFFLYRNRVVLTWFWFFFSTFDALLYTIYFCSTVFYRIVNNISTLEARTGFEIVQCSFPLVRTNTILCYSWICAKKNESVLFIISLVFVLYCISLFSWWYLLSAVLFNFSCFSNKNFFSLHFHLRHRLFPLPQRRSE